MSFLILRDGKIIFDGDLNALVHTEDEYIQGIYFLKARNDGQRTRFSIVLSTLITAS